jgi:hypothetical protein
VALQPKLSLSHLFFRCIDHTDLSYTPGRIHLSEWPVCRRCRNPHSTQPTQWKNIRATIEVRTYDPGIHGAAYLRLRRHGHRDRLCGGLRPIHTYHAVPLPCRSAKALHCAFPIWFTQCGRVWFTHTTPFPCHTTNMPFWKRPLKAMAGSRQGDGMLATCQHSAFSCYHAEFQEVCYQKHTNLSYRWSVWNKTTFVMVGRSVLFWCKDMSACIIYSTKIMITI